MSILLSLSYLLFQADYGQHIIHSAAGCGQTEVVEHLITKYGISPKNKQSLVGLMIITESNADYIKVVCFIFQMICSLGCSLFTWLLFMATQKLWCC